MQMNLFAAITRHTGLNCILLEHMLLPMLDLKLDRREKAVVKDHFNKGMTTHPKLLH